MPKLTIIIGSVRPGRVGLPVATWFAERARSHGGFDEVDVADLQEVDLPFLDEPNHPRLQKYRHDHTQRWSERIASTDAVVFVTSEYNFGYPPALKNAIDYLHNEWHYKPAGIVSYGGVSAGTRAAQQLKQVLGALKMFCTYEGVNIPFVAQFLEDGELHANDVMEQATTAILDEMLRVAAALRPLRS
jgi:NAD(P)H-dependent FMN reductase